MFFTKMNSRSNFFVQCVVTTMINYIIIITGETSDTVPNATAIITLLHQENVDDAITKYNNFSSPQRRTILASIVTTVYNKNASNFEKLHQFGGMLQYCPDIKVAYENLFQRMEENGHNRNPEVVMLIAARVSDCDKYFIEINEDIKNSVSNVLEKWAVKIQRGEIQPIIDFFRRYGKKYVYPIRLFLPDLIKLAYANSIVNFDALITFLHAKNWVSVYAITFPELYHLMEENGDGQSYEDILKLAFEVKNIINKTNGYPNWDAKECYEKNTALKAEFPPLIQKLIWSEDVECYIRNVHYKEYMYLDAEEFGGDNEEREVFTGISKLSKFSDGRWKFIAEDRGKSFKIASMDWKEKGYENIKLAVDKDEKYDELRRKIVTTKDDRTNRNMKWHFVPIKIDENVAKGIFRLRSFGEEYFLYAGNVTNKYDENKRRVFELVGTRAVPSASEWEIDCE